MALRAQDFRGALVADLPRGRLETRERSRLVALPTAWLEAALGQCTEGPALDALAAPLVAALADTARALVDDAPASTPEDVTWALSAALGLHGLGLLRFDAWGDALTAVWLDPPCRPELFRPLAARVLAGVVGALSDQPVHGAAVAHGEREVRVFLGSAEACEVARKLSGEGAPFGAVLARLSASEAR